MALCGEGIKMSNEILALRQENSRTLDLGNGRRALDAFLGAIHYKDNYADVDEPWKDIDLTLHDGRLTKAPYNLTLVGKTITVSDKRTGGVSTIELLSSYPTGLAWQIVPENTRVGFRHGLLSSRVPFEARFRVTGNIPLKTRAFDDAGEIQLETSLVDGLLTEKLVGIRDKQTGQVRPAKGVVWVDPTLDLQVGAGANDGFVYDSAIDITDDNAAVGRRDTGNFGSCNAWARFTGISGLSGAIIDVAYISLYGNFGLGSPLTKIYAENAAAPAAPTSVADYNSRAVTPGQDWDAQLTDDAWNNGVSITTEIQALADSYDPSVIQILHKNDGSAAGDNYQKFTTYEKTGNVLGPKLHIEYSLPQSGFFIFM